MKTQLHPEKDTLVETPKVSMKWTNVDTQMFDYTHSRPLPTKTAQKALDYIAAITKKYPFQIRYAMAQPHWERFTQEWCESGNVEKALKVI